VVHPLIRRTGSNPIRIDDTIFCYKKITEFTYRVTVVIVYNEITTSVSCAYYKIEKINKTCTQLACTLRERNYTDRVCCYDASQTNCDWTVSLYILFKCVQYLPFILSSLWTNLYFDNSIRLYYIIYTHLYTYKGSNNIIILYALLDLASTQVWRPCSTLDKIVNSGIYFELHIPKIYSVTSYITK